MEMDYHLQKEQRQMDFKGCYHYLSLYDAIVEKSVLASHWHADEAGWKVFEAVEGKKSHRWFLWIFNCSQNHPSMRILDKIQRSLYQGRYWIPCLRPRYFSEPFDDIGRPRKG